MDAKIPLIISIIVTAIVAIYALEVSTRVFAGLRGPEYLIVAVVILVVLIAVDAFLYMRYKKRK